MSFIVKCNFAKSGTIRKNSKSFEKIQKEYVCFESTESDLPEFISISQYKDCAMSIKLGDYIETTDGYVCPVISCTNKDFRIASKSYGFYPRYAIKSEAMPIKFAPERGYFAYYNKKFANDSKVTEKERIFAWIYSLTWDRIKAMEAAGFSTESRVYANKYSKRLLGLDKIKREIMNAFKKQIEIAGLNENDFAINRIVNLYKKTEELTDHLVDCIKNKKDVKIEDIVPVQSLLKLHRETIIKVSEWLGYGTENMESEEFKVQINGKRHKPYGHILPESERKEIQVLQEAKPIDYDKESEDKTNGNNNSKDESPYSFDEVLDTSLLEEKK